MKEGVRLALKSTLTLITLWWAAAVGAHETRPAVADISIENNVAKIEVYTAMEGLLAGIDLSQYTDTNDAPEAETYNGLRALPDADLVAEITKAWPRLAPGFLIEGGGPVSLVKAEVDPEPNLEFPRDTRIFLEAPIEAGSETFKFGWIKSYGGLVVRWGDVEEAFAVLLNNGEVSPAIPLDGGAAETAGQNFLRFVIEGFEHIIPKGLDHILFVLGLFFFALAWRPLLWQVTAFTLAHTVTLGLATVGVINIPDSQMWLVETLIALSISYVAIENILRPQLGWWRIVVVFGFGLLHGLGFASVLSDVGLTAGRFIASLVAFNIGVEIGQLAVIAVAFLLILLGARLAKVAHLPAEEAHAEAVPVMHRAVSIVGSLLIAIVGLYWVVERAFL